MVGRIIKGQACVDEGAAWLAQRDARLAGALSDIGTVPLRLRPDGFASLLHAIVSQQVSVAAANGIWQRIEASGLDAPAAILRASEADLRAVGLSRPKVKYARALAEAGIDYSSLRGLPDDAVVKLLIDIKGIGVWTAEIYLMFCLGRADVFAAGDLALQEAARVLYELEDRPQETEFRALAESWSPWKAVAARILFAYYRLVKNREGLT